MTISSSRLDKYKKGSRGSTLSNEEFLRDLPAGTFPDPPREGDMPLSKIESGE